jgi:uncharacterized membrane protein YeaQ/YmgE (transglycosylase-associated protein family)
VIDIRLDTDTIIIWVLVGIVAGALASHVALGHGLGLLGDLVTGIIGAFLGGVLAEVFKIKFAITGHPIITEIIIAFVGAVILLFVLRMLGFGRRGQH